MKTVAIVTSNRNHFIFAKNDLLKQNKKWKFVWVNSYESCLGLKTDLIIAYASQQWSENLNKDWISVQCRLARNDAPIFYYSVIRAGFILNKLLPGYKNRYNKIFRLLTAFNGVCLISVAFYFLVTYKNPYTVMLSVCQLVAGIVTVLFIFSSVIKSFIDKNKGFDVLVVVHRDKLLEQTRQTLYDWSS